VSTELQDQLDVALIELVNENSFYKFICDMAKRPGMDREEARVHLLKKQELKRLAPSLDYDSLHYRDKVHIRERLHNMILDHYSEEFPQFAEMKKPQPTNNTIIANILVKNADVKEIVCALLRQYGSPGKAKVHLYIVPWVDELCPKYARKGYSPNTIKEILIEFFSPSKGKNTQTVKEKCDLDIKREVQIFLCTPRYTNNLAIKLNKIKDRYEACCVLNADKDVVGIATRFAKEYPVSRNVLISTVAKEILLNFPHLAVPPCPAPMQTLEERTQHIIHVLSRNPEVKKEVQRVLHSYPFEKARIHLDIIKWVKKLCPEYGDELYYINQVKQALLERYQSLPKHDDHMDAMKYALPPFTEYIAPSPEHDKRLIDCICRNLLRCPTFCDFLNTQKEQSTGRHEVWLKICKSSFVSEAVEKIEKEIDMNRSAFKSLVGDAILDNYDITTLLAQQQTLAKHDDHVDALTYAVRPSPENDEKLLKNTCHYLVSSYALQKYILTLPGKGITGLAAWNSIAGHNLVRGSVDKLEERLHMPTHEFKTQVVDYLLDYYKDTVTISTRTAQNIAVQTLISKTNYFNHFYIKNPYTLNSIKQEIFMNYPLGFTDVTLYNSQDVNRMSESEIMDAIRKERKSAEDLKDLKKSTKIAARIKQHEENANKLIGFLDKETPAS